MGFPLVRAWSWGLIAKLQTRIGVPGWFPKATCLVKNFQFHFTRVSLVLCFYWFGRLGFSLGSVPWAFPVVFFLFWGCKIRFSLNFSVSQILDRVLGGCLWGIGIESGPILT